MTVPTSSLRLPHSNTRFRSSARAAFLWAAALALPFSGCCPAQPGAPKLIERDIGGTKFLVPNGKYYDEWVAYENCADYVALYTFGIWANATSQAHGYGQEPRDAAPAGSPQGAPRADPPRGD